MTRGGAARDAVDGTARAGPGAACRAGKAMPSGNGGSGRMLARMNSSPPQRLIYPPRRHRSLTVCRRTDERHERRVEWHARAPNTADIQIRCFQAVANVHQKPTEN